MEATEGQVNAVGQACGALVGTARQLVGLPEDVCTNSAWVVEAMRRIRGNRRQDSFDLSDLRLILAAACREALRNLGEAE